mmetsp:Transcript_24268/g.77917  ORF Transcript_24268/g.77917 Transcript_24268/m.77917 type:complete len:210 (-) Transcript_24268:1946-2575(-)
MIPAAMVSAQPSRPSAMAVGSRSVQTDMHAMAPSSQNPACSNALNWPITLPSASPSLNTIPEMAPLHPKAAAISLIPRLTTSTLAIHGPGAMSMELMRPARWVTVRTASLALRNCLPKSFSSSIASPMFQMLSRRNLLPREVSKAPISIELPRRRMTCEARLSMRPALMALLAARAPLNASLMPVKMWPATGMAESSEKIMSGTMPRIA